MYTLYAPYHALTYSPMGSLYSMHSLTHSFSSLSLSLSFYLVNGVSISHVSIESLRLHYFNRRIPTRYRPIASLRSRSRYAVTHTAVIGRRESRDPGEPVQWCLTGTSH